MIRNGQIYDLRAAVDIESQPGYSWVRVVPDTQPDILLREFGKLRNLDASVPALLVPSSRHSGDLSAMPAWIAGCAGAPIKTVQIPAAAAKPYLGTLLYDEPPDLAVVVPKSPVHISLADSSVLNVRMCREDLHQLKREDYYVNGFGASILSADEKGPRIRVPIDHSSVVALNDSAAHAWQTFLTMFIVPGFVVNFNVEPPDFVIVNNRRVLLSIMPGTDLAQGVPCARVHFLPCAIPAAYEAA